MRIDIYNIFSLCQPDQEELEVLKVTSSITINYMTKKKGQRHPEKKTRIVSYLSWDEREGLAEIPTGLLPRVVKAFQEKNLQIEVTDRRLKPTGQGHISFVGDLFKGDGDNRYSFQEMAVQDALRHGRGLLNFPTGSGKTVIMAKIINQLKLKTLIIVPNLQLLSQTHGKFVEYFGEENVDKWGGGQKAEDRGKPIVVATQQTLFSMLKNTQVLFRSLVKQFDILLLDECHHVALGSPFKRDKEGKWVPNINNANSWYEVAQNVPAYYRFGMSATLDTPDSPNNQFVLEAVTGRVVSQITVTELVKAGVLCPVDVTMVELSLPTYRVWKNIYKPIKNEYNEIVGRACVEDGALENNIVDNVERNQIIANIAQHFNEKGNRVLVLVDLVETQGKQLKALLPSDTVFLTGKSSNKEREVGLKLVAEENKILLGTIFKEGFDMPAIDVLIMAGGGKSTKMVIQKIGRVMRVHQDKDKAMVFDFMDRDGSMCERHSEHRKEIYKSEGTYTVRVVGKENWRG